MRMLERAAKAKGDRRAALLIEAADIDLSIPRSAFEKDDGKGGKVMNPQTVVYLEEGAVIQMDTDRYFC